MVLITKEDLKRKLGVRTPMKLERIISEESFPKPIYLPGFKQKKWLESEVDSWLVEFGRKQASA